MGSKQGKVLIIDDSDIQREILKQAIESAGYDVIAVESGLKGIALIYSEHPDAVVCDVVMPEINGYHVCRFIKNDRLIQKTPVVLMTSSAMQKQDKFWGLKSGADAYVFKDRNPSLLLQMLDMLILEKKPASGLASGGGERLVVKPVPDHIKSYLYFLFDKLLFESTLSNEIRKLAELVYDKYKLMAEFALLLESFLDCKAIGVFMPGFSKPFLYIALHKEKIGVKGIRAIRTSIACELARPELVNEQKGDKGYELMISPAVLFDPLFDEPGEIECIACPLKIRDDNLGAVCMVPKDRDALDSDMNMSFFLAVSEFAPIVRTLVYYEETRRLSISDELTGLYNYRYFLQAIDNEFRKFKRYGNIFSILMVDLDGFKTINDVYGHLAGDAILSEVGRLLLEQIREVDLAARYGGDEFILLLPETKLEGGVRFANRLRDELEKRTINVDDKILSVKGSLGVSEVSTNCNTPFDLIAAADKALYMAKKAGRNCIRTFPL